MFLQLVLLPHLYAHNGYCGLQQIERTLQIILRLHILFVVKSV